MEERDGKGALGTWLGRKQVLGLLVVLMLCAVFQLNLARRGFSLQRGGDADDYMRVADRIQHGEVYDETILPAYPVFYVVTQWGGDTCTVVAQIALAFLSPVAIYILGVYCTGSVILSAGLALVSFAYIDNTIYTNYVMAETFARAVMAVWAAALLLTGERRVGFAVSIAAAAVACATKSQFWYIFVPAYLLAAAVRAIGWRHAAIAAVTVSVIPGAYAGRAMFAEKRAIHREENFCWLASKQLLRPKNMWRLEKYPRGNDVVDAALEMARTVPAGVKLDPKFARPLIESYAERREITREEAQKALARAHLKVFAFSMLVAPHGHMWQIVSHMTKSLDRTQSKEGDTIVRKARRCVRKGIEYVAGLLFLAAVPAAGILGWRFFRAERGRRCPALLICIFCLGYMSVLHFIESQGGRHRIPVNDLFLMIDLACLGVLFGGRQVGDRQTTEVSNGGEC